MLCLHTAKRSGSWQKNLKDAGLLKMRREGTKNYYYFDADMEAMNRLIHMLEHAKEIMEQLPDLSGSDD